MSNPNLKSWNMVSSDGSLTDILRPRSIKVEGKWHKAYHPCHTVPSVWPIGFLSFFDHPSEELLQAIYANQLFQLLLIWRICLIIFPIRLYVSVITEGILQKENSSSSWRICKEMFDEFTWFLLTLSQFLQSFL